MKQRTIAIVMIVIAGAATSGINSVSAELVEEVVQQEIVVEFRQSPGPAGQTITTTPWMEINGLINEYQVEELVPVDQRAEPKRYLLRRTTDEWMAEAITALAAASQVRYAEPNFYARLTLTPDDPLFPQQWNLAKVNVAGAWDYDTVEPLYGGDPDVVVAVLDTGVAYQSYTDPNPAHCYVGGDEEGICVEAGAVYGKPGDFSGTAFTSGYDFVNDDAHPNDDNGHGTHVAGTIAEMTDNGVGLAGIAFRTTVMPIKVMARDGIGTTVDIAQGIDFARENGADVINLSLGTSSDSQIMSSAIADALEAGVIIVAATGNESDNSILYPARYSGVVAVGATKNNDDNDRTSYSNYGSGIDLMAPGGEGSSHIYQQDYSNIDDEGLPLDFTTFGYVGYQGTSMASPHVAAAAALLLAAGATGEEAVEALQSTASDLSSDGYDQTTGYGLLDIEAAVAEARDDVIDPVTSLTKDPSRANGLNGYYTTKPRITLEATDDQTGVSDIYYRWDGEDFAVYDDPFRTRQGSHILSYYAIDRAGNRENTKHVTFKTDTVVPELSYDRRYEGASVNTRRLTISGTVDDQTSGVATVTVNGHQAEVSRGEFAATISLTPGLNRIITRVTDRAGVSRTRTDTVDYDAVIRILVTPKSDYRPLVNKYSKTGILKKSFSAYTYLFRGGVNTASGDIDGDGSDEIVTVPASSGGAHVRIFKQSGRLVRQWGAFTSDYRGGLSVAVCDFDNNGQSEIVIGTNVGNTARVRIFRGNGTLRSQFIAFPRAYLVGASIACGDIDGNGRPEIIVAPAGQGGPQVRIFRESGRLVNQFYAFSDSANSGLSLATGDIDGNDVDEIVVAPASNAQPIVKVFRSTGRLLRQFQAYPAGFLGGVDLAVADYDGNGADDIITGAGVGGGPQVRIFRGNGIVIRSWFGFDQSFRGGILVSPIVESRA